MGANLSAFSSKEIAQQQSSDMGGELFTWTELKLKLAK